jgi:predicted membrane GTPase involved in stress response
MRELQITCCALTPLTGYLPRARARRVHLTILIETCAAKAMNWWSAAGLKKGDGKTLEPLEALTVIIDSAHQGFMETRSRRAELSGADGNGRVCVLNTAPARGPIGFQGEFTHHRTRHRTHHSRPPQWRAGRNEMASRGLALCCGRGCMSVSPGENCMKA